MGTDIHWQLQRKSKNNIWYTVMAKKQLREMQKKEFSGNINYIAISERPEEIIHDRDYHVFAKFSGIRCGYKDIKPLFRKGYPDNFFQDQDYDDFLKDKSLHSHGHLYGNEINLLLGASSDKKLRNWYKAFIEMLTCSDIDTPLFDFSSAHERASWLSLQRREGSAYPDHNKHPESLRFLIAYDS